MTELAPCPFCGNNRPHLEHSYTGWSVVCDRGCGCMIVSYDTKEELIDVWNTRQRTILTPSENRILAQKYGDLRKGLNSTMEGVKQSKIFKKFFSR